ncbi:histidine kinase [Xenophilus arseniciresistens]|uniref:histidine kinase n=1 Tax=Xenophilus arseniciresistens TaxID=1283306 RepID=A0AAE3N405_9BURK|nr:histidine kinase [Xenophilus arseniciresistens]MDA7414841.1 histidine kinase [Xenophilus arseniciresistens]
MTLAPAWRSALRHAAQVAAFCALVAAFTRQIWPERDYLHHLAGSLCIGLLTWAVIEAGRYLVPARHCHRALDGGHGWPKGWRGLLLTAVGISAGFLLGDPLANWLRGTPPATHGRDPWLTLLITIAAGAAASFYFHARGKAAAMAAEIAAAERDASEARLKLLEAQLEPHMLFNTLANLRALITLDPPRAVAMLDRLNGYLRATLGGARATQHPLEDEFARLADYLALMAVRMGPRLRSELDLPEALRGVAVPPLLLQPLVENAIRHGLEPQVEGGTLRVSARRESRADGDWLLLRVTDSGAGLPADGPGPAREGGGFGLSQVRERLQTLHGERASLRLTPEPGGGTCALICLPL